MKPGMDNAILHSDILHESHGGWAHASFPRRSEPGDLSPLDGPSD